MKNWGESGIFNHVSDVEGREKVERTRLRVGDQTHKQTVAHVFVQPPVTCPCTVMYMYILLAHHKAIPSLTIACTYIVHGASALSVYAYTYSTYDTGQYSLRYYPAQSPNL